MSNNNTKALKSGIWYTAASFLTKSIGLITTPIFTRMLSKAEFGAYNNYTSWLAIFTIIVTLYLDSTFISARFDHEKDFDGYVFSSLALSSVSAAVWFIIINVFNDTATDFLGINRLYMNCMLTYLVFLPAVHMYQTRERYYYQYKKTVFISLLLSASTAFGSVLMVKNLSNRLTGRIFGSALPTIVIGMVLYVLIALKGKHIKLEYWKYALPVCLPFIPHLLSMSVLHNMDRIMITKICGEEQNALYSLAYSCGAIITLLITSLNSAFSPWLGEKLHKDETEEVRKFSRIYIAAFMYMAAGAMLITPEILLVMGGKPYLEAMYVMPPITCGVSFQFMYTMFVNVEQFKKKTIGMAVASASAALLNYVLNAVFIPRFGYVAAAYTTLAGYVWLLAAHMLLVRWLGYGKVYDYRFVAVVAAGMLAITAGVNWIYRYSPVRYAAVGVYAVVTVFIAVKYGKMMLEKLRKMKKSKA
ncbi:MAG: oligosaccharide flippase family protein [Ruminococcus sp.]|nr:oligosaccharide flippase family protein [Ruminococcus sp.]